MSGGVVALRLGPALGEQLVYEAHTVGHGLLEGALEPCQCRVWALEDEAIPLHSHDEGLTRFEVQLAAHVGRNHYPPLRSDVYLRLGSCHLVLIMARQPNRAMAWPDSAQPAVACRAAPAPPLGTVSRRKNMGTYVRAAAHASMTKSAVNPQVWMK